MTSNPTDAKPEKPKRPNTYSISDLSREFDITTRAIRFYEDQGLLSPVREGQKRIYSPRDRTLLKLILRGKRLGFTLAESRVLFDMYDPDSGNEKQLLQFLRILDEKEALLDQQLHDIEVMKIELKEARNRCQVALEESCALRKE
ncbi:MAG: MerR family transcriptional regulator [Pseudomonadales bacterium]|jgi:DNA-binding transcriptional MerR regulator|uniref:MerR family transcriptional regulator n=1 Tax=unclassified Ketobacter TaxID=2639109 RepID=UPI000C5ABAA3|nr:MULTISPECIES: MerR family DNA-binding transcriptional regulator [unclassified Ketobacter]MAA60855.1 MerR family transcriptional regulator [Pseudomonadales bacterium]MEC8810902.1 MerR family DNA-binding transcriptional regulator [Pseudomonadota bacterium]TNC89259.1 MAG: MerR family transcriptional regulator [Alcanivorax sp.]HAG93931.1 MerR family transcriptional regulator [Gammaproteobacteria bacterium]MAQ25877.1 MerR family transcriptional regulator [Pseudomonadales bacterium]|tara:strand:- start:378 stop:812 length:435 start_codon:yes stop_codon:yes gene_type:complete